MCRRLDLVWRPQSDHITAGVITLYNACCRAGRAGQPCLLETGQRSGQYLDVQSTPASFICPCGRRRPTDRRPLDGGWSAQSAICTSSITCWLMLAAASSRRPRHTVLLLLLPASYLFNPDIGDPSIIHCASWYQCLLTISLWTVRW